jgi:hypothetical protein
MLPARGRAGRSKRRSARTTVPSAPRPGPGPGDRSNHDVPVGDDADHGVRGFGPRPRRLTATSASTHLRQPSERRVRTERLWRQGHDLAPPVASKARPWPADGVAASSDEYPAAGCRRAEETQHPPSRPGLT